MRDRLIELIEKEVPRPKADALAIHLLANGVIVPPCKVGDVVYETNRNGILEMEIVQVKITENYIIFDCVDVIFEYEDFFYESDIGKTVFLTREEAERVLRERKTKDDN